VCDGKQCDEQRISATEIAPIRLKCLLERSGNRYVSLSVILRGPHGTAINRVLKSVARVLVSHAQRIRSLDIHASVNASIPKFMHELPTVCNMECLKASSLEHNHLGFLLEGALDASRLQRVVIGGPYLGLASPDAAQAIILPSLKSLQCTVLSAEDLVRVVRIAATGALESLHLCLSNYAIEGFKLPLTDLSLICSLLEAIPYLSITLANASSEDERLVAALARLKVNRITFQTDSINSGFDGFIDVLSSLPAPNELLCSRVEAADAGDTGDSRLKNSQWTTFSVIDADWHASPTTSMARRRDLQ